jgi:terminase large subunit-like protein
MKMEIEMKNLRDVAYRLDPVLWVREVLGIVPSSWQETFLRAAPGASLLALTARQVGKTTTAAWAIAHTMVFIPGSVSVIACPIVQQSSEAVRKVREAVVKAGAELKTDNIYTLELKNGSRVKALPCEDDSIRGLTVDGWIVADEAARLTDDLIAALRPMRARKPEARFVMLSTAWSRTDPFWKAWASDDQSYIRLKATADVVPDLFKPEYLEEERTSLGKDRFNREYLGIPIGAHASPFAWDLYERATTVHTPHVAPGPAFLPPPADRGVPIQNPFKLLGPTGGSHAYQWTAGSNAF